MNTLPVKEFLSRDFVGVNESDGVKGASELMRTAGETAAVVLRGQEATGLLTAGSVLDYLLDGGNADSTPVSEVMNGNPPIVSPETTIVEATRHLVGTNVNHVIVAEGSEVIGLLDARDLATAKQSERGGTDPETVSSAGTVDARGDVDGEYANQSICEGCGSFSQDLVNVDGQLLCPDCRTV